MLKVGLTGGIGAGKSEVAALLAAHGAVVIDADAVAREVVAPGTAGFGAVVAAFGEGVLAEDGSLDRAALAHIVFSDPAALQRLNSIVHPLVRERTEELMNAAPEDAVVVNEVPLLVEAGLTDRYDVVVLVAAEQSTQLRRLTELRGMAETSALQRIRSQAPLQQKLSAADFVVWNDGDRIQLEQEVAKLWNELTAKSQ